MKNDSLNVQIPKESAVSDLISREGFSGLSEETQKFAIATAREEKSSDGGLMGRLVGTNPKNAAMNTAFLICIGLGIIGFATGGTQWDKIIPAIAGAIGYIFGKASS